MKHSNILVKHTFSVEFLFSPHPAPSNRYCQFRLNLHPQLPSRQLISRRHRFDLIIQFECVWTEYPIFLVLFFVDGDGWRHHVCVKTSLATGYFKTFTFIYRPFILIWSLDWNYKFVSPNRVLFGK